MAARGQVEMPPAPRHLDVAVTPDKFRCGPPDGDTGDHCEKRACCGACFLLARLAIDLRWKGLGLGLGLLRDALQRVLMLSQSVAAPALLVHARDESAREFYLHHAEFVQSPVDPLHLFLPLKAIAAAIDGR